MNLPWNQIHAKVAAALGSGVVATFVLWVLNSLGHPAAPELAAAITTLAATLGGYLTPSGSVPSKPAPPVVLPPAPSA